MQMRAREWLAWAAAGLAWRLAYGWLLHPLWAPSFGWEGDDGYDEIARWWAAGEGYVRGVGAAPTLERLPLYPLLLAALFRLGGGHGPTLVHVVQCLLSTLSLLPLAAMAGRLGGARAGRLALLFGTLHPLATLYNFRYVSEPLHLLLVTLWVWMLARWVEEGGVWRAAGCGLVLGAALLTRSTLAPLAPVALAAAAAARARLLAAEAQRAGLNARRDGGAARARRRWPARWAPAWAQTIVAAAVCLLTLAPGWARAGAPGGSPISSGAAAAVYHGLQVSHAAWERADLGEVDRAAARHLEARLAAVRPGLGPSDRRWEVERQGLAVRLAWESFTARPALRLAETLRNLTLAWYLTYTPHGTAVAALFQVPLIIVLALVARRRGKSWPPAWWPALALVAGVAVLHALVYPHFRFMSPATWLGLAIAAAAAGSAEPWRAGRGGSAADR